jgi:hypothetical protein
MFGSGSDRVINTTIGEKSNMMRNWGNKLFSEEYYWSFNFISDDGVTINFERENESNHHVVQLIIQPVTALDSKIFTIDLRHEIEMYDIYNIKWVSNLERTDNVDKSENNYVYKKVPKVF